MFLYKIEKYYINESLIGHITAEFKFNILEVFTQHFKIHNIVVLSFRSNEIIIQTMNDPGMVTNIETQGLYTTTIPLESLEEYEFECNKDEVNVMVTNALTEATSKVATGCNFINVVTDGLMKETYGPRRGPGEAYKYDPLRGNKPLAKSLANPLVEVSFDLYEKKRRHEKELRLARAKGPQRGPGYAKPKNDDCSILFGKLVETPYLHYLVSSRMDHPIQYYFNNEAKYKSIIVRNPIQFKRFYGHEQRIFVGSENEAIVFCGCHLYPPFDAIIQSDRFMNYDEVDDYEVLGYEVPNKPFKYLLKFMGSLGARAKPMGIQVTNFEILIREDPPEEVYEPESFKAGKITFNKCIPSCVKSRIADQQKRLRNRLLELNFDRRDDWSNISRHSHVLKPSKGAPAKLRSLWFTRVHN